MFNFDIQTLLFLGIIIIISLSLHEYAHAWMANRLGDPTPRLQWRLTPSPLAHVDPIGFIMIFLIGFWRWKPILTNPNYFRNPVRDDFLTAMAWPFMNFGLAFVGMVIMMIYGKFIGMDSAYAILHGWDLVLQFWGTFIAINIALGAFNILPIFPLDGYRIIKIISPSVWYRMEKNGTILSIVMIVLLLSVWSGLIGSYIGLVTEKIMSVFFLILSQIFF